MTYGSLHNVLASNASETTAPAPAVGDGATILGWTDRRAATVIEVKSPTCIVLREDKVEWGEWGATKPLSVEPDPNGRVETARKNKDGKWRLSGYGASRPVVLVGVRSPYYDWNF